MAENQRVECETCHFYYPHPGCVNRDGKPHKPEYCWEEHVESKKDREQRKLEAAVYKHIDEGQLNGGKS